MVGYYFLGLATESELMAHLDKLKQQDAWCESGPLAPAEDVFQATGPQPEPTAHRLRWITHSLGRLLGIQDEDDWM